MQASFLLSFISCADAYLFFKFATSLTVFLRWSKFVLGEVSIKKGKTTDGIALYLTCIHYSNKNARSIATCFSLSELS